MNSSKLILAAFLTVALLVSFQNCSQVKPSAANDSLSNASSGQDSSSTAPTGVPDTGDTTSTQLKAASQVKLRASQLLIMGNLNCALTADKRVACWGSSSESALLTNTYNTYDGFIAPFYLTYTDVPVTASAKQLVNVTSIYGFGNTVANQICAIVDSAHVYCGSISINNSNLRQIPYKGVSSIAVGLTHYCVQLNTGLISCRSNRVASSTMSAGQDVDLKEPIKSIAAGLDFTCALVQSGLVKCWGVNSNGQLGNNLPKPPLNNPKKNDSTDPVLVEGLTDIKDIFLGEANACAISRNNLVSCWGKNIPRVKLENGQLVTNSQRALVVSELNGAQKIVLGSSSCAKINDNESTVKCWSSDETNFLKKSSTPSAVAAFSKFKDFAVGPNHACIFTVNNTIRCMGQNLVGQLGNNLTTGSVVPVDMGVREKYFSYSESTGHYCYVNQQSKVVCSGLNDYGQLGRATNRYTKIPSEEEIEVPGGLLVQQVAVGRFHSCALGADRNVYCWGCNFQGQLGRPQVALKCSDKPILIPEFSQADRIMVSSKRTCALKIDRLFCTDPEYVAQSVDTKTNTESTVKEITAFEGQSQVELDGASIAVLNGSGLIQGIYASPGFNQTVTFPGYTNVKKFVADPMKVQFDYLDNGSYLHRITGSPLTDLGQMKDLFAGPLKQCALTEKSTVVCWTNTGGQVYENGTLLTSKPAVVEGYQNVAQVYGGSKSMILLSNTGQVYKTGILKVYSNRFENEILIPQ